MARTRASVAAKVVTGKSSKARCNPAPPPSSAGPSGSSGEKSSKSHGGGNPVCPRETPKWQKPITNFFIHNETNKSSDNGDDQEASEAQAGSSKTKSKRNIIHSDDEDEQTDRPKNNELDETIDLEPLNGEDSHKINEYFDKNKEKEIENNKENVNTNIRKSKRHLDELDSSSEENDSNKRIKS